MVVNRCNDKCDGENVESLGAGPWQFGPEKAWSILFILGPHSYFTNSHHNIPTTFRFIPGWFLTVFVLVSLDFALSGN